MTIQTINPGSAPIVWSTIDDAFAVINDNFTSLVATIGDYGVTPIDFSSLSTNVSPSVDGEYSLGSPEKRWRDLHLLGSSIYIGDAIINSTGTSVNLPAGSTIGGTILDSEFFKEIAVSGQSNVVADPGGSDVLTLVASTGVGITTDAAADSITFTNTGVTSAVAGTGISVSGATGAVTITNAGVVTNVAGAGITVSAASGNVTISNAGIISVVTDPGSGISLDTSVPNTVRVTNSAPNISQDTFKSVAVAGQTTVVADSANDTLTLVAGTGIAITTNDTTDSITISSVLVTEFDLKGSVFADDSTMLVDATNGVLRGNFIGSVFADDSTQIIDGNSFTVYGNIEATTLRTAETKIALGSNAGTAQGNQSVAIGENAGAAQGSTAVAIGQNAGGGVAYQGDDAVAIGHGAGENGQGTQTVAVGLYSGQVSQGINAVAIGAYAGVAFQPANTIILNASGSAVNGVALQTNSFYVAPIRNATGANGVVQYDATTKEVSYSSSIAGTFTGNVFTTLIDSADSSAITVTPAVIFSANINIENDIQLSNIDAAIRGTDKIKFVPSNADELSYNVRLDVYSESTIEPRLALDTPDGVDLTLSSGMAGIVISKINGRVNLAAGNNAFIVRENGSWAMTPLAAAPLTPTVGMYIADCTNWDPASKANGRPYPVWYDGVAYNALY